MDKARTKREQVANPQSANKARKIDKARRG